MTTDGNNPSLKLGAYLIKNIFSTPIATVRRSFLAYRSSIPVVDAASVYLLSLFREHLYRGDSIQDLLADQIPLLCTTLVSKNPFYAYQRQAFILSIYLLTRSSRPVTVVETGALWGFTSLPILQGMVENNSGHLFSIDLPARETILPGKILVGRAVPKTLSTRWRLTLGETRHRLPSLLRTLGNIDCFLHDSLHSYENMRFEMEEAWRYLRPGGLLVVDDVDANAAFPEFANHAGIKPYVFKEAKGPHFGVILRPR